MNKSALARLKTVRVLMTFSLKLLFVYYAEIYGVKTLKNTQSSK